MREKNYDGFTQHHFFSKKSGAGFTLIETLVYIVLFTFIIGGLLVTTYNIIESTGKNQLKVAVQEEGGFVIKKIEWALSGATSITVSPTTLSVTKASLAGTGQNPLLFALNGQNLELKRGSGLSVVLNSGSVGVTALIFTHIPPSGGKPRGIKANITLTSQTYSQSFETIKYLRK